mmetsp:Transcript_17713/g.44934  ORF Transcript_17713/g.44934 Transcript_17713/m.44934 type:complete len:204 (+) Transcript_17713:39-650(+)
MLWYRATRPWAMDVVISFHYPSPTFSRAGLYAFLLSRETASPGVRSSLAWRDLAGPQLPHVCHAHDPPPCACASRAGSYDSFGCITGGGAPGGAPCGGMTALSSASAPCRMPFSMRSSRAATLALADAAGSSTVLRDMTPNRGSANCNSHVDIHTAPHCLSKCGLHWPSLPGLVAVDVYVYLYNRQAICIRRNIYGQVERPDA